MDLCKNRIAMSKCMPLNFAEIVFFTRKPTLVSNEGFYSPNNIDITIINNIDYLLIFINLIGEMAFHYSFNLDFSGYY